MHGSSLQLWLQYWPGWHWPVALHLCPASADHALHSVGIAEYIFVSPMSLVMVSLQLLMSGTMAFLTWLR